MECEVLEKQGKNIINYVKPGSIAAEMGVIEGDILVSINQQVIEDMMDYQFLVADDFLEVELEKLDGTEWILEIDKDYDEELGIQFVNEESDATRLCKNKCVFCFIDQMPPGMRDSLYVKDDDARLSFLQGNYITLTNLSEKDIEKIIRYRISPLNISIHTTDPELRNEMLNNRYAGEKLKLLNKFHDNNINMNLQIVLCPGWNDGIALDKTLKDLDKIIDSVMSIAIVPVGITKFRDNLPALKTVTKDIADNTLKQISNWQEKYKKMTGEKKVYASDEIYLLAGISLPEAKFYENFHQLENGVGMMALFQDTFIRYYNKMPLIDKSKPVRISIATGVLSADMVFDLSKMLEQKIMGLKIDVYPIKNEFFGKSITVSGLITGKDLINQLANSTLDSPLIIPENMLRDAEDTFLDDITIDEVANKLTVPVIACPVDGKALIKKILRITAVNPKIRSVVKNGKTHCCSGGTPKCGKVNLF
ncbi:MAG: DUF512 domain-containing protein [Tindallia sp. MSAO_Bac2]|nr:MAG: DUF512 domain-containing protein [Tindallia sp. MSAO_Bac2]